MSILATIQDNNNLSHLSNSIFNIQFLQADDELNQLKEAILLAKSLDEDVLLFSKNLQALPSATFDTISEVIIELASNNIMMLLADVDSEKSLRFSEYLEYIEDIASCNSFFITSPMYSAILALIDNKEDYDCDSLLKLTKLVNPYNLKFCKGDNFEIIQRKINVISPFRNASVYISEYLESIQKQQYNNYKINLIDDHSDIPYDISDKINDKVKLIINSERKFALQNILDNLLTSNYCDDDIICFVDADDTLLHNHVFEILNAVYSENPQVNMTYGSFACLGRSDLSMKNRAYTRDEFETLRQSAWLMIPLRSFKFQLFKKLLIFDPALNCLRNDDGEFFKMPYDMALFFPLIELAGYNGVEFLNTRMYGYRLHENNDHVKYRKIQYESEIKIRNKPSLKLIS